MLIVQGAYCYSFNSDVCYNFFPFSSFILNTKSELKSSGKTVFKIFQHTMGLFFVKA